MVYPGGRGYIQGVDAGGRIYRPCAIRGLDLDCSGLHSSINGEYRGDGMCWSARSCG